MKLRNIFKGGSFTVILVILFIIFAIVTFAYFQKSGFLADYKVNMFSSVGSEQVVTDIEAPDKVEDLSIGVTEQEVDNILLGKMYTAKAENGDSITTLARQLAKRYIVENNLIVSQEQKIFIEDYIQNNVGDYELAIGDEITVSATLINQAVLESQALTQLELDYLKNFVELVWDATF